MNRIAVLLASHNRKEKTLACLDSLFKATEICKTGIEIDVYLTDDGSNDGTAEAVKDMFPEVRILYGNGSLYWAGGMRNSWNEALNDATFDSYLLLNDDVILMDHCFEELKQADEFSKEKYGTKGIYIGSIKDQNTQQYAYGGRELVNKWTFAMRPIIPDGRIKECMLGNGNIMLVCKDVVDNIGILCTKYIHGKADYDYSLRANEKGIPVLVCANYCGYGCNEHDEVKFGKMNIKERIQFLYDPKGIELPGYMYLMWRFFPWRAPFVFCSQWLKVLFPFLMGK